MLNTILLLEPKRMRVKIKGANKCKKKSTQSARSAVFWRDQFRGI